MVSCARRLTHEGFATHGEARGPPVSWSRPPDGPGNTYRRGRRVRPVAPYGDEAVRWRPWCATLPWCSRLPWRWEGYRWPSWAECRATLPWCSRLPWQKAGRSPVAEQLELVFDEPTAAPGRPAAEPGPKAGDRGRPRKSERTAARDAGPTQGPGPAPAAIPARCPVVGRPVCYRDGCRHYQGGGCVHPEAVRPRRRRRRR